MPGTLGLGGGPDPAGTQCGGPPGPGGGSDPAGTKCEDPPVGAGVTARLTVLALPDPLEDGLPACGEELAEAGTASQSPTARAAPASDTPPITRRCLRSPIISMRPFVS